MYQGDGRGCCTPCWRLLLKNRQRMRQSEGKREKEKEKESESDTISADFDHDSCLRLHRQLVTSLNYLGGGVLGDYQRAAHPQGVGTECSRQKHNLLTVTHQTLHNAGISGPEAAQPNTALWFESIHFLSLNNITRLNDNRIPVEADSIDGHRTDTPARAGESGGGESKRMKICADSDTNKGGPCPLS